MPFTKCGKFFSHYFFSIIFASFSLSSLFETSITCYVSLFYINPYIPEVLFLSNIFFFSTWDFPQVIKAPFLSFPFKLCSLFPSDWLLLYWSVMYLLTCPSVICILPWNPSNEYFISNIISSSYIICFLFFSIFVFSFVTSMFSFIVLHIL